MLRNQSGFTLIELMIVVLIIGILAAIAVPNFVAMSDRAKESGVKSNMHTIQLTTEDFAVQNVGVYPVAADQAALVALMPGADYPPNPFTGAKDAWVYAAPAAAGIIGFSTATTANYVIEGHGRSGLLALQLAN